MNRRQLIVLVSLLVALCFAIPLLLPIWFFGHRVVHVVLLAGGDNVEGFAHLDHLEQFMTNHSAANAAGGAGAEAVRERFAHLRAADNSNWTARDDVFIFAEGKQRHGPWRAGTVNMYDYGAAPGLFGPEVELAHVLGETFDEPVVIVKAGYKDRSLEMDWKSPSRAKNAKMDLGYCWAHTLHNLQYALQHVGEVLGPKYKKHRTQLVGMIWWHGYEDALVAEWVQHYTKNLKLLLHDFRTALDRPHLPLVVAVAGAAGNDVNKYAYERPIRDAQQAVCMSNDENNNHHDEEREHTKCVETHRFVHPEEQPHYERPFRYYGHGDSMIEISGLLADSLVELYFKQYNHAELQQEIEGDYNAYVEKTDYTFTLVLLVAVAIAFCCIAMVRSRCTCRTLTWNWNRLFFVSTTSSANDDDEATVSQRQHGRQSPRQTTRRRRKGQERFRDELDADEYNDDSEKYRSNTEMTTRTSSGMKSGQEKVADDDDNDEEEEEEEIVVLDEDDEQEGG